MNFFKFKFNFFKFFYEFFSPSPHQNTLNYFYKKYIFLVSKTASSHHYHHDNEDDLTNKLIFTKTIIIFYFPITKFPLITIKWQWRRLGLLGMNTISLRQSRTISRIKLHKLKLHKNSAPILPLILCSHPPTDALMLCPPTNTLLPSSHRYSAPILPPILCSQNSTKTTK